MLKKIGIDSVHELKNLDDSTIEELQENSASNSTYRTNYLLDEKDNNQDIYKILEDNAWLNQKKTIVRPQSLFTGSSFNIPVSYHEPTTAYADFMTDTDTQNKVINENDFDYFLKNEDIYDPFENDDDIGDIIEAFNPNVKVKEF